MRTWPSNVSVRSNVFIRANCDPLKDKEFLSQIRGREAIQKLLRRIVADQDTGRVARTYLSKTQLAEVAWQSPCAICGALPEGSVQGPNGLEVQFRCPRGSCRGGQLVPRAILLDIHLIRELTIKFGKTIPEILTLALQSFDQSAPDMSASERKNPSVNHRRVTVLLTRSHYHFLTDADIELALGIFLGSDHVIG
jgi:hypothetical protein